MVKPTGRDLAGDDSHTTFYLRTNEDSGMLTFASALDAEIYRQRLLGCGQSGWLRAPLEQIDLERLMSGRPERQRRLMLALGFSASDTQVLLQDDQQLLITPLLPVSVNMLHTLHGVSRLCIEQEIFDFVEQWWDRVGGHQYSDLMRITAGWSDSRLAQSAHHALDRAAFANLRSFREQWGSTGHGDECAVFSPDANAWQFSSLSGPRVRALH
ncbi:hypothetical protein [Herbaspirillum sp. LeCh32-8]|uniref:hypothetical protein n=1 Tax=Herbaspirillum sp. LeCh32-8 TaxID=2821356 RepID=UPI001FD73C85|nr:hypothetical protein [Herbaspirillum sp. LeCh32-8]